MSTMPGRTINGLGGEAESSRKRPRITVADQDEENRVVDVQEARSNLRNEAVCHPCVAPCACPDFAS